MDINTHERVVCGAQSGDVAVSEAPTYYLAHQMFRERGMELREVPIESDGMDIDALEKLVKSLDAWSRAIAQQQKQFRQAESLQAFEPESERAQKSSKQKPDRCATAKLPPVLRIW